MPYTLYTDRNENFECEVSVKNASLKGSMARLVVESANGINLVFNGKIENGKCHVPIRRLKGILDESTRGNMFLEVIVEDTYFSPWKSDFIIEEHTTVKVKVNEQKQSGKPIVEVKVPTVGKKIMNESNNKLVPVYELAKLCERFNINKSSIRAKQKDFRQLMKEYFNANPEYIQHKNIVLNGLKHLLK